MWLSTYSDQVMLENIPEECSELLEDIHISNEATIEYDTFISVDCGGHVRAARPL